MSTAWYAMLSGKKQGPFTLRQLRDFAVEGKLKPGDLVCEASGSEWRKARDLEEIFPTLAGNANAGTASIQPPQLPLGVQSVCASPMGTEVLSLPFGIGRMHRQRAFVLVAAMLGAVGTFMPWVHAPVFGTIYGTAGDGWITFALFMPAFVLAVCGDRLSPLLGMQGFGAAIPAALAACIAISKLGIVGDAKRDIGRNSPLGEAVAFSFQAGSGIYLILFAGVVLPIGAWLFLRIGSTAPASSAPATGP